MQFYEKPNSPTNLTSEPVGLTRLFGCSGEYDEFRVQALARQLTEVVESTEYGLAYRQNIEIQSEGHGLWSITVPYGPKPKEEGRFSWSFSTMGGTVLTKQSQSTVGKFPADAPDHGGLIGVRGEGEVDGTEIVIPSLKYSIRFRHDVGALDFTAGKRIARNTGCVNEDPFLTFAPGEVLFLGGTGNGGDEQESEVTYEFAMSENLQNLILGGIEVAKKDGWDVGWIYWRSDATDGKASQKPQAFYVERVYRRINFRRAFGFG